MPHTIRMKVKKCLFGSSWTMKRYTPTTRLYPDPSKPLEGEVQNQNITEGSKRVKTSQSFESLFDNETLSDVIVNVNDGEYVFYAHKMILGMKSSILAAMLDELSPSENDKPILFIHENTESSAVFCRFLYFIYSGSVWLHRDYVIALQKLADKYDVQPLIHHCENFITQILNNTMAGCDINSRGFPLHTVCDLQEDQFQSTDVRDLSFKVLCMCFKDLVLSDKWPSCSYQLVCDLLKSEFCQAEENIILTSATEWMKKNNLNEKSRIEDILINIKYPLLHRRVLYHMQKNGAFKNFPRVQELLNNAVKYHCFKDVPEAQDEFVGNQFTPRQRQLFNTSHENNNYTMDASPTSMSMRYSDSSSRENVTILSDTNNGTLPFRSKAR